MQTDDLKQALKKYKKENYYVRSCQEYYDNELKPLVNKVARYVKDNNIKVDVVVPILRGGNVPATFLAYALDVLQIIPVQYKYFFTKTTCELRRILSFNTHAVQKENPTLLLVEGNHCYGNQAKHAAKDLRELYPKSRIIYAASNMDYNHQDVVKDADATFYGRLTNDCKELTEAECKKLNLTYNKELLFPWENVDEEWAIVELKQHKYSNVSQLQTNSTLVKTFDLS